MKPRVALTQARQLLGAVITIARPLIYVRWFEQTDFIVVTQTDYRALARFWKTHRCETWRLLIRHVNYESHPN